MQKKKLNLQSTSYRIKVLFFSSWEMFLGLVFMRGHNILEKQGEKNTQQKTGGKKNPLNQKTIFHKTEIF